MGRPSTAARTNGCLKLDLNRLIKQKFIIQGINTKGTITWSNGAGIGFRSVLKDEQQYLQVYYQVTNKETGEVTKINSIIKLTTVPSNLGKGQVLYFLCPFSNKRCRVLYMAYGSHEFRARTAYKNRIYYISQISGKYDYWLDRWHTINDKLKELKKQPVKSHYKGKPTRLQQRIESLEKLLQYYDERRQDIFVRRIANWGTYLFK